MNLDQPEQLLDHGHLLRSLAGALPPSATDVDDVVQNTFTAAIQKPRPTGWPLPQWLSGVTRNLARRQLRDQARRTARERAAAKPEALRSTAEVVVRPRCVACPKGKPCVAAGADSGSVPRSC